MIRKIAGRAANKESRFVFPDDFRPDFEGFRPQAFAFLRGLARNNDRAWFNDRKDVYANEIRFPMECLVAAFGRDGGRGDVPVRGNPTKALFRPYRDIRFSKDKSPYKTHAAAVLSRSGNKHDPGIVYIHIAPRASFVSGGYYMPDRALLAAWRTRMVERPDEFLDIVASLAEAGEGTRLHSLSALKTMPRGFEKHADSPVAEYLRCKGFLVTRDFTDEEESGPRLVDIIARLARTARPILEYGWAILDEPGESDPRRHVGRAGSS